MINLEVFERDLKEFLSAFDSDPASQSMMQEARREKIVEFAVGLADRVLTRLADGSTDDINLLTGLIAARFMDKTIIALRQSILLRKELLHEK